MEFLQKAWNSMEFYKPHGNPGIFLNGIEKHGILYTTLKSLEFYKRH